MAMHNSRNRIGLLGIALSMLAGTFSPAGTPTMQANAGGNLMLQLKYAYISRPKNGGHGRGNQARIKRAAKRRKNIRARASKRS